MVGSRCTVVSVGTVVGGPISPWRPQPVGGRSCIDPSMCGWFDVGRLACGLFIVVLLSPRCLVGAWVHRPPYGQLVHCLVFLLLPALSRPRPLCRRCVRSGLLRAKVRVCAARYGEPLWLLGRGFDVGCFGWLVSCQMVESRPCGAFVGMVASGLGAACCLQPMGRRSRFDPCMSGRLGVGWLACGLFIVGSLFCSSLVGSRLCSPRRCSWTLFLLSCRFALRVAAAALSGVVDVLRPGRARCVVLVRRCWFASGRPVWNDVVVRMGQAGRVW